MQCADISKLTLEVDARGLSCPLPLLKAKQGLAGMKVGEQLLLLATDGGSWRDVASFAELSPHTLVSREDTDGEYRFVLQKGA